MGRSFTQVIFLNKQTSRTRKILSCTALLCIGLFSQIAALAGSFENAQRLIELLNVENFLEETILDSVSQARDDMLKRGLPSRTVNQVTNIMHDEMIASMPDLVEEITNLYAEEFSDEELTDLIAFYQTPTGQKFVQSERTLSIRQSRILDGWLKGVGNRARNRLSGAQS